MEYKTPPYITLQKSKEVIFYISRNNRKPINIDIWTKELNLIGYKGLVIHSKCIFNRLKNDNSLDKNSQIKLYKLFFDLINKFLFKITKYMQQ